jgi:murein L,D-transpeptidase YcbB/YkuD
MCSVLLLVVSLAASGCHSQQTTLPAAAKSTEVADAVAAQLHTRASAEALSALHSAASDRVRPSVPSVYEAIQYTPAWLRAGQATPQALSVISALQHSQVKGLNPDDYDASLWSARLEALKAAHGDAAAAAQFDVELTACALRYLSNLRTGRVNPKPLLFDVALDGRRYDLAQFLVLKVLNALNPADALSMVEPQYLGYRRTEDTLQKYMDLAAQDHSAPLSEPLHIIKKGDAYSSAPQLAQRLRLLGDLPQDVPATSNGGLYDATLQEAVKRFQTRHGLTPNGNLDRRTLLQLNTPLSARVVQLRDSLERWRWLPADYPQLPVAINIPGFELRVFSDDHQIAMRMNVVVGKAILHQTPAFAKEMKYIVFRPYWNLPLDIVRTEMVPKLRRDPRYLEKRGFETTDQSGHVLATSPVSPATLAEIRSGKLLVRQKPGPSNALGLIKFIFPNEFEIYLHSTPTPQLFNRSRRDFSHGCIRVEEPAKLAAWLLRDQPQWTLQNIEAAMQSGADNREVLLTTPAPVVIAYLTAIVEENGEVYFYDDIYGEDKTLDAALAKGLPYR